ncbi:hypothetical protein L596_029711 [Steinernema carpocapsae]|uniref:Uncharacterized protein n=1 Tax=Steinernema carpocapsae TaxID=34508 RepID=A0A4U5LQJ2_STECR|nr:hypothetical protein L596_029711 [Steinernema carpocapsae]
MSSQMGLNSLQLCDDPDCRCGLSAIWDSLQVEIERQERAHKDMQKQYVEEIAELKDELKRRDVLLAAKNENELPSIQKFRSEGQSTKDKRCPERGKVFPAPSLQGVRFCCRRLHFNDGLLLKKYKILFICVC